MNDFHMDVDLNLLRVFDTLIELRSVTRAAERLGLTQSAVSHALRRLREALDDPLFVRGPIGLQPTARADEIAPGVREGLSRLRGALASPVFDHSDTKRRFTIAAGNYFCSLLLPMLVERARREAPHISFRIVPIGEHLIGSLDRGAIDLALGSFVKVPGRFAVQALSEEEMVWIASAANPIVSSSVDADLIEAQSRVAIFTNFPFDIVEPGGVGEGGFQQFPITTQIGRSAPPSTEGDTTVYDSQTALAVVARTDMIALVPRRTAMGATEDNPIVILKSLKAEASIPLSMMWHKKQDDDAGLAWLRAIIRQLTDTW